VGEAEDSLYFSIVQELYRIEEEELDLDSGKDRAPTIQHLSGHREIHQEVVIILQRRRERG
jgi:hypothetical protein